MVMIPAQSKAWWARRQYPAGMQLTLGNAISMADVVRTGKPTERGASFRTSPGRYTIAARTTSAPPPPAAPRGKRPWWGWQRSLLQDV